MKSFLCRLANCNKNSFKGIIKHADKKDLREFITFVSEVMHKKITIPKTMIRMIRNNRHVMRHLISPSYSLRSKQKYLIQKGGAGLGSISRGLARAAEDAGQAVGHGARTVTRARAAEMLAAGQGSGVRLRSGAQALSRRQAEVVRAPRQVAREQAIAQARGSPSSRIAGMARDDFNRIARIRRQPVVGIATHRASDASFSTPSRTVSDADFFPEGYQRILSSGETPSFSLSHSSPMSWQAASSRAPSSMSGFTSQSSRIAGMPRRAYNRFQSVRGQPVRAESYGIPSRTASDLEFFSPPLSRDYAARTAADNDFFRAPSTRNTSLRSMTSAEQPSLRSYQPSEYTYIPRAQSAPIFDYRVPSTRDTSLRSMTSAGQPSLGSYQPSHPTTMSWQAASSQRQPSLGSLGMSSTPST